MENKHNKILVVCSDIQKPFGGIKQIYRQVDVLKNNGYNAYIMHENCGFKCQWFDNSTSITWNKTVFEGFKKIEPKKKHTLKGKIKKITQNDTKPFKNIRSKNKDISIDLDDVLVFPEIYGSRLGEVLPSVKKVIYIKALIELFLNTARTLMIKEHHIFIKI